MCSAASPDSCGATCVSLNTDRENCGRCGYSCESFQQCLSGICSPRYESTRVTPNVPGVIWDVAIAADGSLYVAGTFKGTVDFDPAPGMQNVTAEGVNGDAFVSRFDAANVYLWTRTLPSAAGVNVVHAVSSGGAVLLSGAYQGTMNFLTAYGGESRTARTPNADEGYLLRIEPDGRFGFLRTFPSTFSSVFHAESLTDGSVAVVGPFLGPADFGSGPQLDGVGGAFMAKLSATGVTTWVRTFPGAALEVVSESVGGSLVTAGSYTGMLDIDPGAATVNVASGNGKAMFVVKLDSAGLFASGGSVAVHARDVVPSHVIADATSIYTVGRLADGMFPTGPVTNPRPRATVGEYDAFVSKLAVNGTYEWGKLVGGSGFDYAQRITLIRGGVLAVGAFGSPSVDFGPEGAPDVRSVSAGRLFLSSWQADGSYRGTFNVAATPTVLRATDTSLQLGGNWSGVTDFNPRADEKDERGSTVGAAFISTYRF